ncbi:MAG: hypothetical protein ACHBNF_13330 [Chromatiales bacterium]
MPPIIARFFENWIIGPAPPREEMLSAIADRAARDRRQSAPFCPYLGDVVWRMEIVGVEKG